ncbi:MAG: DUF1329 domain-containing protein, partial [Desulfatitalea sp.]|nr:DUF1329 domain-containing protein [Desulfatitalea sp.]NNK01806.1 DUF1329 domain-containing protein [Desulfatitalea sp.]
PLACNFPEIKIVPTRQYYYSLPVSEATRKNAGQTKLNEETGIIKEESYISGYPFPKPEGKFKATEAYYNWMKRYWTWDSRYQITEARGWRRSLKEDFLAVFNYYKVRLQGRVTEPIGWFDQRAKEQGEFESYSAKYFAPRDMFGNVVNYVLYSDPEKNDHLTMYVSTLRRVRLLSATDAQDAVGGGDGIYLDTDGCVQKPSLTVYPSKLELIGEREILFPSNNTGTAYVTSPSKGLEYLNLEWERRPVYIIKMQVLDKNFVYSYRIMYMDKETFLIRLVENYDQKGRLYRTTETIPAFIPEMGVTTISDTLLMDHIDLHSTLGHNYIMPTPWLGREAIGLEYLFTTGK